MVASSRPKIGGRRGAKGHRGGKVAIYIRLIIATLFIIFVSLYIAMSSALLEHQNRHQQTLDRALQQQKLAAAIENKPIVERAKRRSEVEAEELEKETTDDNQNEGGDAGDPDTSNMQEEENENESLRYNQWKDMAVGLAKFQPADVLETLEQEDPFGVRTFEKKLLQEESDKNEFLTLGELESLFPCPSDRITLPDQRDNVKAREFRNGKHFLFFQHLRKAGGTNFCALAEKNLPKRNLPDYYCMPDYEWGEKNAAGYLHHIKNEDIISQMGEYRIAGNEWDSFDHRRFFDLPAIFATSFRKPLDRALSQFRFECVEDRGCSETDVGRWWKTRGDLVNVYTWTFADPVTYGLRKIYKGDKEEDAEKRGDIMGKALDVLIRFNLVLCMEWLAYAETEVKSVLGFHNTEALTSRVRPHATGQFQRNDGQEKNNMGAAGITKASWDPKEYLTNEQYEEMSRELAMDEILTDAARRIFLERLVCNDV